MLTPQGEQKCYDFRLLHLGSHLCLQRCSVDLGEEKPGKEKEERGEETAEKVEVGRRDTRISFVPNLDDLFALEVDLWDPEPPETPGLVASAGFGP